MKKILFFLSVAIIFSACNESNDDSDITNNNKNYFFNKNITYWKMENNFGDTAYFQSLDDEPISIVMRYWDTANKINLIATPIQFVYWENGMKKRQYFAIIKHNKELYFAAKNHPLIANYNLDFYIYLFSIPNDEPKLDYKEVDSIEYSFGNQIWEMHYMAEWYKNNFTLKDGTFVYSVLYSAFNNLHSPQAYSENFSFTANIGFYSYMGIIICQSSIKIEN